jgi:hypothetical protein
MPASDEHLPRRLPTSDEYRAQRLTPYPLPTKDSGLLRTVGDARTYLLTLPKARKLRVHWQLTSRLREPRWSPCRGSPRGATSEEWRKNADFNSPCRAHLAGSAVSNIP